MMKRGDREQAVRVVYLIGDDGCDKSCLFGLLELEQEELNHEINVYVKVVPADAPAAPPTVLELYDFSTDRIIRSAMALYLKLLPPPSALLYFVKDGASEKDICEWVRVLHQADVAARVAFLSDVTTYREREKVLTRLAKEFEAVLDFTHFPRLEPYAFRRALEHLEDHGTHIHTANCLKPTLTRKIANFFEKLTKSIRKRRSQGESSSVV